MLIFISGVHGVGKTYFCNMVKNVIGIESYSASKLIEQKKNAAFSQDKLIPDIDDNQPYLLQAVNELKASRVNFILDGHFCLLNSSDEITRIPLDTFQDLNPDAILLLMEKPDVIAARRKERDGSVVIAHSSPGDSRTGQPGGGVQISAVGKSSECEAYKLADKYMSQYYPEWYERYPVMLNDPDVYFDFEDEDAGRFTWNTNGANFSDPENIAEMTPAEVLEFLFGESSELTANDALSIVLQNTDYTEDELTSNDLITESGETFHALSFYRNGTYVFYVRDKDGKFFTSDDFNKAYNEDYDGYIGHD